MKTDPGAVGFRLAMAIASACVVVVSVLILKRSLPIGLIGLIAGISGLILFWVFAFTRPSSR